MTAEKILNILLVEDDDVDVMNMKRAFERNRITNPLFVAADGIEALEMLRSGKVPHTRRMILLDLTTSATRSKRTTSTSRVIC